MSPDDMIKLTAKYSISKKLQIKQKILLFIKIIQVLKRSDVLVFIQLVNSIEYNHILSIKILNNLIPTVLYNSFFFLANFY